MDLMYILLPFLTWFLTGIIKFLINSIKSKSLAFKQTGYGGFPSNHSSILSSMCCYIYLSEGVTATLGALIAVSFLFIIDAIDLRNRVGSIAKKLNEYSKDTNPLRERMGHTAFEIIGGIVTGAIIAYSFYFINPTAHF